MENQIPWHQLILKLQNSPDFHREEFEHWYMASVDNQKLWSDIKDIYEVTGEIPEYFYPKEDIAWIKINDKISKPTHKLSFNSYLLRIAASLFLVALGIGGSWMYNQFCQTQTYSEVYSPFGHRTMVLLPDSSTVWLNGNSRLKYQNNFSKSRNVELAGEAMFQVRRNQKNLFTVKTDKFSVEVYGTKFDLRSYPAENESEISLIEGSIGLFRKDQFISGMKPGEVINYNNVTSKFVKSRHNDLAQITSWNSDELIIDNKSMDEICRYLERWYGVEIKLDKRVNKDQRLSFKIKTESLRELLWIIDKIKPIKYTIDGKRVRIEEK